MDVDVWFDHLFLLKILYESWFDKSPYQLMSYIASDGDSLDV